MQRSCEIAGLSRTAFYRVPVNRSGRDAPVIEVLNQLVAQHPRWGFWKCFDRMRLDGCGWNHKRVHRVYCEKRLNLPRRTKRRIPTRQPLPLDVPGTLNQVWSLDFVHDALYDGRRFRTMNVLDDSNREALGIEVVTSIPSASRLLGGFKRSLQHLNMGVAMTTGRRKSERCTRAKLRSPGRARTMQRAQRQQFWVGIAAGHSTEEAAAIAKVSWLRIPAMPGRHSEGSRATIPVQAGLMSGGEWTVVENDSGVNDLFC